MISRQDESYIKLSRLLVSLSDEAFQLKLSYNLLIAAYSSSDFVYPVKDEIYFNPSEKLERMQFFLSEFCESVTPERIRNLVNKLNEADQLLKQLRD